MADPFGFDTLGQLIAEAGKNAASSYLDTQKQGISFMEIMRQSAKDQRDFEHKLIRLRMEADKLDIERGRLGVERENALTATMKATEEKRHNIAEETKWGGEDYRANLLLPGQMNLDRAQAADAFSRVINSTVRTLETAGEKYEQMRKGQRHSLPWETITAAVAQWLDPFKNPNLFKDACFQVDNNYRIQARQAEAGKLYTIDRVTKKTVPAVLDVNTTAFDVASQKTYQTLWRKGAQTTDHIFWRALKYPVQVTEQEKAQMRTDYPEPKPDIRAGQEENPFYEQLQKVVQSGSEMLRQTSGLPIPETARQVLPVQSTAQPTPTQAPQIPQPTPTMDEATYNRIRELTKPQPYNKLVSVPPAGPTSGPGAPGSIPEGAVQLLIPASESSSGKDEQVIVSEKEAQKLIILGAKRL